MTNEQKDALERVFTTYKKVEDSSHGYNISRVVVPLAVDDGCDQ